MTVFWKLKNGTKISNKKKGPFKIVSYKDTNIVKLFRKTVDERKTGFNFQKRDNGMQSSKTIGTIPQKTGRTVTLAYVVII